MRLPVTVTGNAGSLNGEIIAIYTRETIPRQTEAPTVRNYVHAVFNANPAIGRVAVVVSTGLIPIFVIEVGGSWFDVTAQPVRLQRREPASSMQGPACPPSQRTKGHRLVRLLQEVCMNRKRRIQLSRRKQQKGVSR